MVAGESQYLVFLIILPGITAFILLPLIESLLVKSKITCFNFRQKVIPEGMGLLFYLAIIPSIWGAPALSCIFSRYPSKPPWPLAWLLQVF